jgi:hypothetical protein
VKPWASSLISFFVLAFVGLGGYALYLYLELRKESKAAEAKDDHHDGPR